MTNLTLGMERPREGIAIPAVLVFLLVVVPLVFTLSLRSRNTLRWISSTENHFRAILLADEGKVTIKESLRRGLAPPAGNRGIEGGGMEFQLRRVGTGDLGQPLYAFASEGLFRGEETLLLGRLEDFADPPGTHMLIESDRSWSQGGPGGGSLTDIDALILEQRNDDTRYLDTLRRERNRTDIEFVNIMERSSRMLDTPDVEPGWASISAALGRAKVR